MNQPARDQPVEGGVLRGGGEQRVERQRHWADEIVELRFRTGEAGGKTLRNPGAQREAAIHAAGVGRAELAFQMLDDRGAVGDAGKRQRHQAARAEQDARLEPAILQRHLGIAAEAEGAHGDCLDHGAITPDGGAFRIEARPATIQYGDVGGGAADVGDDGVVEAGHVAGADEARGGA